jgi:hypothetical protein
MKGLLNKEAVINICQDCILNYSLGHTDLLSMLKNMINNKKIKVILFFKDINHELNQHEVVIIIYRYSAYQEKFESFDTYKKIK